MSGAIAISPGEYTLLLGLLQRHLPHTTVWAYGSRVKWNARPQSDLDLVAFAARDQQTDVLDLREALEESSLPFPVVVLVWDELPESFRKHIVPEYVVLQHGADEQSAATSEWQQTTLGEVCEEVRYGYTASATDRPTGTHFLRVTDVSSGSFDWKSVPFCEIEDKDFERFRLKPGDIVIARMGTIGVSALIQDAVRAVAASYLIRHRIDKSYADPRFVSYVLHSPMYWDFVNSHGSAGSVQPNINARVLGGFRFHLPPLPEQRAIAHVLGTLDDKIELNRRMNETLEAMARALFQDWFVDFGPTRARLAGRAPYLPPELWALFPERLVDSELGEIPAGWEVGTIGACFHLTMGQSPPGSTYNDDGEGLPFFQGRTDFGFRYPTNRRYCTAPSRLAEPGDTLVSVRAPVGDINTAWEKCCIGRGLAALRHKSGSSSFTYYAVWAIQRELQQYEHTGTVFGAINKKQFETLPTIKPPSSLVEAFDHLCYSSQERIRLNTAESRTLATLRDTLLPKLVSGKVQVGDSDIAGEIGAQ